MNTRVQISFWDSGFKHFNIYPRVEGWVKRQFYFNFFSRISILFSQKLHYFAFLLTVYIGSNFYSSSPTLVFCHPSMCEVISHCGFWFTFSWLVILSTFPCICQTSACLLCKMSTLFPCQLGYLFLFFFFPIYLYELIICFGYWP